MKVTLKLFRRNWRGWHRYTALKLEGSILPLFMSWYHNNVIKQIPNCWASCFIDFENHRINNLLKTALSLVSSNFNAKTNTVTTLFYFRIVISMPRRKFFGSLIKKKKQDTVSRGSDLPSKSKVAQNPFLKRFSLQKVISLAGWLQFQNKIT